MYHNRSFADQAGGRARSAPEPERTAALQCPGRRSAQLASCGDRIRKPSGVEIGRDSLVRLVGPEGEIWGYGVINGIDASKDEGEETEYIRGIRIHVLASSANSLQKPPESCAIEVSRSGSFQPDDDAVSRGPK